MELDRAKVEYAEVKMDLIALPQLATDLERS
jgi:hypothetical protein